MHRKITKSDYTRMTSLGLSAMHISAYIWLHNKRRIGQKIIVGYKDFVKWFKKNSVGNVKTLERTHTKRVIRQLGDRGFAEVKPLFGGLFEIILFDLDFVYEQKSPGSTKKSRPQNPSNDTPAMAKDQRATTDGGYQQQLIYAKKLLNEIGVNYKEEKVWWEIVSHGIEKIEATIEYFKFRLGKGLEHYNPAGWIRQALRRDYYLNYDPPINFISRLTDIFQKNRANPSVDK